MKEHIILTDAGGQDEDDRQSLISYLFFSNEFDTKAIVSTRPDGTMSKIKDVLTAYGKDYDKFLAYSPNYQDPELLKNRVINGKKAKGVRKLANLIKNSTANRDNPLYITVWGNIHSLAEALQRLNPIHYDKIVCISVDGWNKGQDPVPYTWLENNAKKMKWIRIDQISRAMWVNAFTGKKVTNKNYVNFLRKNAGALGKFYNKISAKVASPNVPRHQTAYTMKEGDSPTWIYALWGNKKPTRKSIAGKYQKHRLLTRHFIEVQAQKFQWNGYKAFKTFDRDEVMKRFKERVTAIYN